MLINSVMLYAYLLVHVAMIGLGGKYLVSVTRGVSVVGPNGGVMPKWLPIFLICLGFLGIASSAPSIFSNNPYWFADKIFFAVRWFMEMVT